MFVNREVMAALNRNKIGAAAYREMRAYIEEERERLGHPESSRGCLPLLDWAEQNREIEKPPVPVPIPLIPATPPPPAQPSPLLDGDRVRAAITKLHEHAQAQPETRNQKPETIRTEPPQPPRPKSRSLAERLFTPENVHILQSLGICIIFLSTVAFVRTQLWSGASDLDKLGILVLGTLICGGAGMALRRWTSLRITALGFLILGQLSLLIDTYAALFSTTHSIYPYSPSSLWTFSFALFTATALYCAKKMREPLFEAFTFLGSLAAWGAAAIWSGVDGWLVPAAFVPALFISGALSRYLRALPVESVPPAGATPLRRWSLPWWYEAGARIGADLLAVALPTAAIGSVMLPGAPGAGSAHLPMHLTGTSALAMLVLFQAWRGRRRHVHSTAFLFLFAAPFVAYVHAWPREQWCAAMAIPGAVLALCGLLLARVRSYSDLQIADPANCSRATDLKIAVRRMAMELAGWGAGATIIGVVAAICVGFGDGVSLPLVLALAAGLVVSLAFAILERKVAAVWCAAGCSGMLAVFVCELRVLPWEWWPLCWLAIAMFANAATFLAKKRATESAAALRAHAGMAADSLAVISAGTIWFQSGSLIAPWIPSGPDAALTLSLCSLTAYVLLSSFLTCGEEKRWQRGIGIALLSPMLVHILSLSKLSQTYEFAVALSALPGFVALASNLLERKPENKQLISAHLAGAGVLILHSAAMCGLCAVKSTIDLPLVLLAFSGGIIALRLRQSVCAAAVWTYASEAVAIASIGAMLPIHMAHLNVQQSNWINALSLDSALMLLVAFMAESISGMFLSSFSNSERPFRIAGKWIALLLSGAGTAVLAPSIYETAPPALAPGLLAASWVVALVPFFMFLRSRHETDAANRLDLPVSIVLGIVPLLIAGAHTISAQFWMTSCSVALRANCAVFFAALLLISLGSIPLSAALAPGKRGNFAYVPPAGFLSVLGLIGCAMGAWNIPIESLGLIFVLLCTAAAFLLKRFKNSGAWQETGVIPALDLCRAAAAFLACGIMLHGLFAWPNGWLHAFAIAGWLLLPNWRMRWGREALGAGLCVMLAVCHGMRAAGMSPHEFGPGLVGVGLALLALRAVLSASIVAGYPAEKEGSADGLQSIPSTLGVRQDGLLAAAIFSSVCGLAAGFAGSLWGLEWHWIATLAESAALMAWLSVIARKDSRIKELPLWLELGCFFFTALAVHFASGLPAWPLPLHGAAWILVAALFLIMGMALESICGAALPKDSSCVAFLESRHIACAALCALGLLQTCTAPEFNEHADHIWRALISAAALAAYGSMARWSVVERWTRWARRASGVAAYLVLLPAGYLFFLIAHSTGSSWGALCFIVLSPALLAISYVLERQKQPEQSALARFGAAFVCAGSLIIAFAGNRAELPAVPSATLAVIAAQALLLRGWRKERAYSHIFFGAISGSLFFAIRTAANLHLFSTLLPWELPCMALLGILLIVIGGAAKLERDETGLSLAGKYGAALNFGAMIVALIHFLSLAGISIRGPHFESFIVCLLLTSLMSIAARRWLNLSSGEYTAPVGTLLSYLLYVWVVHPAAWEFYGAPVALFLFAWAWQTDRGEARAHESSSILLALASAFALAPSFIQALPFHVNATAHFFVLVAISLAVVLGAMYARRKIPLMSASSALVVGMIIQAAHWAHHRRVLLPVVGIAIGFGILAVGSLFESRMNQAFRQALDRAKVEARMFWVSWQ